MKIAVFGLGNFGMSLAIHLADTGNEVVVADHDREKVDYIKDKVSHAVVMDVTHERAYRALPLNDIDIAVVAIGTEKDTTIMTTAIVKKVCDAKIIARSSSSIQDTIFKAMGIDLIIHPEQEYAERMTKKINLRGSIDNFEIEGDYLISEVEVNKESIGKTLHAVNFREEFNLNVITILRQKEYKKMSIRRNVQKQIVIGMPKPDTKLEKDDVLVVFGKSSDIEKYLKHSQA